MPLTPFHFGPGALLHAVAPRHVSFWAFVAANVLIDVESLINLVQRRHPVHAFFHTYVGATLVLAFIVLGWWAVRRWLAPGMPWARDLTVAKVGLGAALGAYSHVLLDSVMHADIRPMAPFTAGNGLLATVSLGDLHGACVVAGLVGLLIVAIRRAMARVRGPR
jgi:membrane-bound metal-dependent hydrolase YbcI (DUF457 family)